MIEQVRGYITLALLVIIFVALVVLMLRKGPNVRGY